MRMFVFAVVASLAACGGNKSGLPSVRDHMCACRDAACAAKADSELTAWLSSDEAKSTPETERLIVEIGECAMKIRSP